MLRELPRIRTLRMINQYYSIVKFHYLKVIHWKIPSLSHDYPHETINDQIEHIITPYPRIGSHYPIGSYEQKSIKTPMSFQLM